MWGVLNPPSLHNGTPEVSSWAAAASQCSKNGSRSFCSRHHAKTSWSSLTAPEDPDHPWSTVGSDLYCKLKRTCKVKAHCFWLGLPSAVAEDCSLSGFHPAGLKAIHSLKNAEKETGKNDMKFPWPLGCILSSDHCHKLQHLPVCHTNKQQMSEVMLVSGEHSFQIQHRERYGSSCK